MFQKRGYNRSYREPFNLTKFIVSMVGWTIFLTISTLIVWFVGNYMGGFNLDWFQSFTIAFIARLLFTLNAAYRQIERDYGI